jgi:hypothetical protein
MSSIKITILIIFLTSSICLCYAQNERDNENSDESKILKDITPFNYTDQTVKTLKIPKRKYDSPLFCDELIEYKNGFIINSITSSRAGRVVDFTTNFFYYNISEKSLKKIDVLNSDTIESVICSKNILYYSVIKNGKRDIGLVKGNQYQSLIENLSLDIRTQLDTTKWIKLGIEDDKIYILSPNFLFEFSNNNWERLTSYSIDDFYINKLKYRRSISMLPTKNVVVKNNSAYFLQEIVQDRTCNLLKLNIDNGNVENYFTSLDYTDNYLKQINDFTFLNDNSLLVSASRLLGSQMLINTKENKVSIWVFNNGLTTSNGTKVELPVTTTSSFGDTLILASNRGLFLKYPDNITPLVYFDNYHQSIKEKIGLIDFNFDPRSIKKISNNIFIIGGMWGGLYQIDILNNKLTCLDDIDYDKIRVVDLSEL